MSHYKSGSILFFLGMFVIGLSAGCAGVSQAPEYALLDGGNLPEGLVLEPDGAISAAPGYALSRLGDSESFVVYQQPAAGVAVRLVSTVPLTCACTTVKSSDEPCPLCPVIEPGCKGVVQQGKVRCKKDTCGKRCKWVQ